MTSEPLYRVVQKFIAKWLTFSLTFTHYNPDLQIVYPIFLLGDIKLYMNHYEDFDDAVNKWEERKKRINWENLFIMMHTEKEIDLVSFDKISYKKKVCFVPFESQINSALSVRFYKNNVASDTPFFSDLIKMALGQYKYYNAWDLIMHGEKKLRIKM